MSSVFSCLHCKKEYNETNKKPLSLPCGHVFCEDCLNSFIIHSTTNTLKDEIENEKNIKCPTDSKIFKLDIRKIPCCYQILINLPGKLNNNKPNYINNNNNNYLCPRHPHKKIKYCCINHQVYPCSICVVDHMGTDHQLESYEASTEKLNNDYKNLMKMNDYELNETMKLKDKTEKHEKTTYDYFTHQINKIENTFDKLISILEEKKKGFTEIIKNSFLLHKKKFEIDKGKLNKKLEKLNLIKNEFFNTFNECIGIYKFYFL
jgi:hypothetical protein